MNHYQLDCRLHIAGNKNLKILSNAFGEGNLDKGQLLASRFLGWIIHETYWWDVTNQIGIIFLECQLVESFGDPELAKGQVR